MRKPAFAYAKTKTQISFAVTAKLISAFVFATWIVQSLYFLNPKFQASSHLRRLYSPVCVGPGRKPRRPVFSQRGSNLVTTRSMTMLVEDVADSYYERLSITFAEMLASSKTVGVRNLGQGRSAYFKVIIS